METNEHALLQNLLNQLWDAGFRPFAGMQCSPESTSHGHGEQKTLPQMDAEAHALELLIRKIAKQEIYAALVRYTQAEIGLMTK